MYPIYFTALLKTQEGEVLETGRACVAQDSNTIDFKNEFIPLLKLGTTVRISGLVGNEELYHFTGEVYLSSKRLLRVDCVDDDNLKKARSVFSANASIPAELAIYNKSLFFSYKKANKIGATIYYFQEDAIKFSTIEQLEIGQQFMLEMDTPINLKKVVLEIESSIVFGNLATGYICKILSIPKLCHNDLIGFLEELRDQSRTENMSPESYMLG